MAERSLDYIQVAQSFWGHPKVRLFARVAHIELHQARLILLRMWALVAEHYPDSPMDRPTCEMLVDQAAEEAGVPTKDREPILRALVKAKFLDADNEIYNVHGWEDHAGMVLSERRRRAERERERRARDGHVTARDGHVPGIVSERSVSERNEAKRSAQDSRAGEPEIFSDPPKPPESSQDGPFELAAAETPDLAAKAAQDRAVKFFEAFWEAYPVEYRIGRAEAAANWQRLITDGETPARIMQALKNYIAWCTATDTKLKHPCRFLGAPNNRSASPYLEFIEPRPLPPRRGNSVGAKLPDRGGY